MRIIFLPAVLFIASFFLSDAFAQDWKPAETGLKTRWAEKVTPSTAWQQYPRPQLVRDEWLNLNGLWNYAITAKDAPEPETFDGQILVPFPVESSLSGVKKKVMPEQCLWYRTSITVPDDWAGKNILLNFEACDWETEVWINGRFTGIHRGGYSPFSFDITSFLENDNELIVRVWDPTDTGYQPVGKQVNSPGGIFYTSTTGIWQTIWLEPVNRTHISGIKNAYDPVESSLELYCDITGPEKGDVLVAAVSREGQEVTRSLGPAVSPLKMNITEPCLWSPDNPCLYDIQVKLVRGTEVIDRVSTYAGLRSVSVGRDSEGHIRMMLNGEFLFQNGPLDQGFWPDGIYTPPAEEAMVNDLLMVKALGFNMLRKHVKVENRRFYHWCDRLGIMVWQDMPNGDLKIGPSDPDIMRNKESALQFEYELTSMIGT